MKLIKFNESCVNEFRVKNNGAIIEKLRTVWSENNLAAFY